MFNHHGDKLPISSGSFSVQVTDTIGTELQTVLCTTGPECTATFTPQMSGLHEVSGLFLGQQLTSEQTHIPVKSNNPVLKYGRYGNGNGTFHNPWGIAIDKSNFFYVADVCNKLIQKFSADGEFLYQFSVAVHDKDHTVCDIALDPDDGLIFCTEILLENNTLVKGHNVLVFDLEGELQHTYPIFNAKIPLFIARNRHGDIILSEIKDKCLLKIDKHGNFNRCMGNLKYPCYITISHDDSMIVSDRDDDCVYVFNHDGEVKQKIGCSGTGKGQLKTPWGVATDGENILVADSGNKRIQVFKNDGSFVLMIESNEDPLSDPRGLAVTGEGYVLVTDSSNQCIKKYKYKDILW